MTYNIIIKLSVNVETEEEAEEISKGIVADIEIPADNSDMTHMPEQIIGIESEIEKI